MSHGRVRLPGALSILSGSGRGLVRTNWIIDRRQRDWSHFVECWKNAGRALTSRGEVLARDAFAFDARRDGPLRARYAASWTAQNGGCQRTGESARGCAVRRSSISPFRCTFGARVLCGRTGCARSAPAGPEQGVVGTTSVGGRSPLREAVVASSMNGWRKGRARCEQNRSRLGIGLASSLRTSRVAHEVAFASRACRGCGSRGCRRRRDAHGSDTLRDGVSTAPFRDACRGCVRVLPRR